MRPRRWGHARLNPQTLVRKSRSLVESGPGLPVVPCTTAGTGGPDHGWLSRQSARRFDRRRAERSREAAPSSCRRRSLRSRSGLGVVDEALGQARRQHQFAVGGPLRIRATVREGRDKHLGFRVNIDWAASVRVSRATRARTAGEDHTAIFRRAGLRRRRDRKDGERSHPRRRHCRGGIERFGGRFTGTSNGGFWLSDGGARDDRIGWRLTSAVPNDPGFADCLDATRCEPASGNAPPEHGSIYGFLLEYGLESSRRGSVAAALGGRVGGRRERADGRTRVAA